jgi:uncharacterized membrane protein
MSETNTLGLKQVIRWAFISFVVTMFVAALFHLVLLFVVAALRGNSSILNPVEFLGISYVAPSLSSSRQAMLISWLGLILLYLIVLKIALNLHKIVAFWYTSSTYGKLFERADILKQKLNAFNATTSSRFKVERFRSLSFLVRTRTKR